MGGIRVYANVGQRDVQIDGKPLDAIKDQARNRLRESSREILESLDGWLGELSYPILEPALRRVAVEAGEVDRLILGITDQPPGSAHHATDTIHLGEILARVLSERGLCRAVELWRIGETPHRYGPMMEFFRERIAAEPRPAEGEARFVLLAGGIPAANTALLYQASVAWGESCRALATEETGQVQDFSLAKEILVRDRREKARTMAEAWDLGAIRFLYPERSEPARLATLAWLRECLDIEKAHAIADGLAAIVPGERKAAYQTLAREMKDLVQAARNRYGATHVAEAFWQADLFRRRGQVTEMIGRLVLMDNTLQEWALRRWLAPAARDGRELNDAVSRNPTISSIIRQSGCRLGHDNTGMPLKTRGVLIEAVATGKLAARSPDPDPAGMLSLYEGLKDIRLLRNKTAAGHGFAPVDEATLKWMTKPITAEALTREIEQRLRPLNILSAIPDSPWLRIQKLFLNTVIPMCD